MDSRIIDQVSRQVYQRFPELQGSKPKVAAQAASTKNAGPAVFVLTFRGSAQTANGKSINPVVRVTVDENGKIIKFSSSR
jgi:hypothetical protein